MRRIVVMQQTWRTGDALLRASAGAAARMNIELTGLFVEDINLLHLAGMPFASEVCFPSATRREMNVTRLENSLRALARDARLSLEAEAQRAALRASFRVARGTLLAELLAAASATDVVVAGALSLTSHLPGLSIVCMASVAPATIAALIDELSPWVRGGITLIVLEGNADVVSQWESDVRENLVHSGMKQRVRLLAPRNHQELGRLLKRPAAPAASRF